MKKIVMLLCLLLVLAPTQVFAHSKVTESSPAADAKVSQSPEQITITFNTTIASMSTFTLVNQQQEEQVVNNIAVNEDELSGDIAAPLENGTYSVNYQIIGADGHAIDGSYQFTVEAAVVSPAPSETTEPEASIEPTAEPTPSVEPTPAVVETDPTKKDNSIWPYIGILCIIAAAVTIAMRKRK